MRGAAAVVGSGRGVGRFNYGRKPAPDLLHESSISGGTLAAIVATCTCAALNSIGISMLASSMTDSRGALVADYDSQVEAWEQSARGGFASIDVDLVAHWSSGRSVTLRLTKSETSDQHFKDSERGKGLLPYHTLSYSASIDFGSYYPGAAEQQAKRWEPLPERSAAPHVHFEFVVRSRNGTASTFATQAVPLAWDEIVHARTPAPDDKCLRERHGIWRNRNCHIVKRLDRVCVQVQLHPNGTWTPVRKELPPEEFGHSAPPRPEVQETFGCDPKSNWSPASFSLDPCWGRPVTDRCPLAPRENHTVTVRVRSAVDPYIRAEELTNDTFDFGLSPSSLRANGAAMLAVGLCVCMLPCARVYQWRRRRRRDEERRSLREERDDCEDRGCPPGIYGNTAM